jgi:hypothetical protein
MQVAVVDETRTDVGQVGGVQLPDPVEEEISIRRWRPSPGGSLATRSPAWF